MPPYFVEIFQELKRHESHLGGLRNFSDYPQIGAKVKAQDFRSGYTDYEYIYLTVLGFARLQVNIEEIVKKNNGKVFTSNPGVQLLERLCGMTMHGDREGANVLLRSAPVCLIEAFQIAKSKKSGMKEFFKEAFDRNADPCLEGRTGRIMEYLEAKRKILDSASANMAPWEDVSVKPLPAGATPQDIVGEHLRVFMSECTWSWSRHKGISYEDAKVKRMDDENLASFTRLYNAEAFEAALLSRGVVPPESIRRWEARSDNGEWMPYDEDICTTIERAITEGKPSIEVRLGPKSWKYILDFGTLAQKNPKTKTQRPIRWVDGPVPLKPGKLSCKDMKEAIQYFIDLETLPRACSEPSS